MHMKKQCKLVGHRQEKAEQLGLQFDLRLGNDPWVGGMEDTRLSRKIVENIHSLNCSYLADEYEKSNATIGTQTRKSQTVRTAE